MPSEAGRGRERVRSLLTQALINPASVATLNGDDLDLLLRVARRVRLLGRLAADLRQRNLLDALPLVAQDQLMSAWVLADARARLARWELDRIAWAMQAQPAIPLVALKGCAYLLLDLPNAAGRIFADVDLMTGEPQLPVLERTLNSHGWMTRELTPYDDNYYREWTHELPPLVHREREVEIDLHHNVLAKTARLRPVAARLLEKSRPVQGSRYRVLADEDIVLHAMVHLMFDSDLADKLRDLVDIRDLLVCFSARNQDFWSRLVARAAALDLRRPAYYALRYSQSLLDLPVPEEVVAATHDWAPAAPAGRLMDCLVPVALYPEHPDRPQLATAIGRLLLYVRSHWIRMPPWLLVYHLGYKVFARNIKRLKSSVS